MMKSLVLFSLFLVSIKGDCYLHNPRGSNNRYIANDDNEPEVENANRLFDSQNNNDGGYEHSQEVGDRRMGYYAGSKLVVQWSTQHACGRESTTNCEFILQYMCSPANMEGSMASSGMSTRWPRDGSSNNRVNYNENQPSDSNDASTGMHEPWYNYHSCDHRRRNTGLFLADREAVNGLATNDARSTRQNNNANRQGLECPEERDYYPYWAPSDWIDIAVITNDLDRCELYWNNTQNTNPKYRCVTKTPAYTFHGVSFGAVQAPITEADCNQQSPAAPNDWQWEEVPPHIHPRASVQAGTPSPVTHRPFWNAHDPTKRADCQALRAQQTRGEITQAEADRKCAASANGPLCIEPRWQRDNHLGYISGGHLTNFTWMLPNQVSDYCVFRVRYNISSSDYDAWDTFAADNSDPETGVGGILHQDQLVQNWLWDYPIELALNTNQYGRTFQDRSHTFRILNRDTNTYPEAVTIHNLNVRGKRGHITQVYPSTTYTYTPEDLHVKAGDFVHFQWEGASTYPSDYFGGGEPRTDRHNLIQIAHRKSAFPLAFSAPEQTLFSSEAQYTRFASAGHANLTGCTSQATLETSAALSLSQPGTAEYYDKLRDIREDQRNCWFLNPMPRYFNEAPIQFSASGTKYSYFCSRNDIPGIQRMTGSLHVEA